VQDKDDGHRYEERENEPGEHRIDLVCLLGAERNQGIVNVVTDNHKSNQSTSGYNSKGFVFNIKICGLIFVD
tara:strand:- start:136 stop:351 length:216 start_codon:yes stop_codon:yes gene_type:complete